MKHLTKMGLTHCIKKEEILNGKSICCAVTLSCIMLPDGQTY